MADSVPTLLDFGKFDAGVSSIFSRANVERACRDAAHAWRDCGKLTPARTAEAMVWQMVHGNAPCEAVRQRAGGAFTASAYCQARARLPLATLETLARQLADHAVALADANANANANATATAGPRVFLIDGTGVSLPDAPAVRAHFGCSPTQREGCGYPTTHLLLLTGPGGVAVDAVCSPLRTGDMTHAARTHARLRGGDVLVGDSLFSGFGHLWTLSRQGLHGLFPVHHARRKVPFGRNKAHGWSRRFVKRLGHNDQLVEYRKTHKPKWMDAATWAAAPPWLPVREVRRVVRVGRVRRTLTLVTTLRDAVAWPPERLVRVLGGRWAVELSLRDLKTTMGMERLRCQSVAGVRKELLAYLIAYNLLRLRVIRAAARLSVEASRVGVASVMYGVRHAPPDATAEQLELAAAVNPARDRDPEPRVVKRRRKPFAVMTKPRAELRELLGKPKDGA